MVDVKTFYDEHPLNEGMVLSKLEQEGKDLSRLKPEDLLAYDQDHYGGTAATDALAVFLEPGPDSRVLDICSGLGGTSRYLAHRYGATVVGFDLSESRTAGALNLTRRVGLQDRITHVQGDATAMALEPDSFDGALSQEAFVHIADKTALFASCYRVLKPGGRLAFTDWIGFESLAPDENEAMRRAIAAEGIVGIGDYERVVAGAGFKEVRTQDVSGPWQDILHDRLEMYRALEQETVRSFGESRHRQYIEAYEMFVGFIDERKLGGVRLFATK